MSLHRNRFVHLAAATCLGVGAMVATGTPALADPHGSVQPPGRDEGHPPPGSADRRRPEPLRTASSGSPSPRTPSGTT